MCIDRRCVLELQSCNNDLADVCNNASSLRHRTQTVCPSVSPIFAYARTDCGGGGGGRVQRLLVTLGTLDPHTCGDRILKASLRCSFSFQDWYES